MARRISCLGSGCLAFIVVAVLVPVSLGLGWWLFSNVGRVLTHESVEAVVVDLIQTVDSDGDTLYRPVYEFEVGGESGENAGGNLGEKDESDTTEDREEEKGPPGPLQELPSTGGPGCCLVGSGGHGLWG